MRRNAHNAGFRPVTRKGCLTVSNGSDFTETPRPCRVTRRRRDDVGGHVARHGTSVPDSDRNAQQT